MSARSAGQVWAHVGQPFPEREYDLVIVGAGRMGAALARSVTAPGNLRVLLVEEGGLPNEEGATILAPGVWCPAPGAPAGQRARVERTAALLGEALHRRGLLRLAEAGAAGARPASDWTAPDGGALDLPPGLLRADAWATFEPGASTFSPASRALHDGQAAVRQGADLMLNARGALTAGGVQLSRLAVTNTHEVVVERVQAVAARHVVVAAGAASLRLLEAGPHELGGTFRAHRTAYRQAPRLNLPTGERTPVIAGPEGLLLRPHSGGFTLAPAIPHPDPWGHVPRGGVLGGVPTGLRRELLDTLLDGMDALPGLGAEQAGGGAALVLGRSLPDVPGAWVALPAGGWPLWERLSAGVSLLLGGPRADLSGLAMAEEAARQLQQDLGR